MQDRFLEYLNNTSDQEHPTRPIALTDNSYKNKDHSLDDRDINCRLATYGDALLKLAYCKILFDEGASQITVEKQKYESDKTLVEKIAQHYDLLKYIRFDENGKKIPEDYKYEEPSKPGKDSTSKYIATAVEALLAAIYLDNNENFGLVVDIAKSWKNLIDEEKNKQQ